jgi:hypothetical protein
MLFGVEGGKVSDTAAVGNDVPLASRSAAAALLPCGGKEEVFVTMAATMAVTAGTTALALSLRWRLPEQVCDNRATDGNGELRRIAPTQQSQSQRRGSALTSDSGGDKRRSNGAGYTTRMFVASKKRWRWRTRNWKDGGRRQETGETSDRQ